LCRSKEPAICQHNNVFGGSLKFIDFNVSRVKGGVSSEHSAETNTDIACCLYRSTCGYS